MISSNHKKHLIPGVFCITIFLAVSFAAIWSLAKHERQRDFNNWQINLGIKADIKTEAVNNWLNSHMHALSELAHNPSLKLYSQQLITRPVFGNEPERAQLSYLQNLLHATAKRHGFMGENPATAIKANVSFKADSGIALLSRDKTTLVATPGFVVPENDFPESFESVLEYGKPKVLGIETSLDQPPRIRFLIPFSGLHSQKSSNNIIGAVYAYTPISPLFQIIKHNKQGSSEESMLISMKDNSITFLSPLADGTPAMTKSIPASAMLASSEAANHPGIFGRMQDYSGEPVLFTSRKVNLISWVLVQKVLVKEALRESNAHQKLLIISLVFSALLAAALMTTAWIQGNRIREKEITSELENNSRQLQSKNKLLDAINNNISDMVLLVSAENQCIFANLHLAKKLAAKPKDLENKTLTNIFGNIPANILQTHTSKSLAENKPFSMTLPLDLHGRQHLLHTVFTPIAYQSKTVDTVLIAMHDMTEIQQARQNEADLLQKLIMALMNAIDMHDPYSANHSAKTSSIAVAIGKAMKMDSEQLQTVEIAANLCNLGKLSISQTVLVKEDKLSDEELREIRQESQYAWDMLKDIDFDGPVKETIMQKHEHLDGSGHPHGLKGEDIIISSRILGVANAFIAMISPRAYRERLTHKAALDQLITYSESRYDRKVLAALFQVVENEIDWPLWDNSK